ncbi:MAG: hypothetical protein NT169_19750 [Chloroflexi bacterium]|nr:hypothetical protein [Chloroflexota bacterium]
MRKWARNLLVLITLVLAACGPAMKPATDEKTASGEIFILALPRIVIDFDAGGNPSILGMKLEDAGRLFGADISGQKLNEFYVDWMAAANVQHIEMRQTGDGLALLANGQPLPHIAWDDASLQAASGLAALFNVDSQSLELIKKLLPITRRLGLDVVATFPLRPDAKAIALADASVAMAKAKPEQAPATAIVQFEIKYDERGIPAILGISAQDLLTLGINAPLALNMDAVHAVQARNIQHIELRTKPDGLFVYVNGAPLPNLVWDNALLISAADVYSQMNPGSSDQEKQTVGFVKQFIPTLDNMDIAILVHFPLASGAQAIPAKIH